MSNDNQQNYRGEQSYYTQNPQTPNYQPSQIPNYPTPQFTPIQNFDPVPSGKINVKDPKPRNGWRTATIVMSVVAITAIILAFMGFTLPHTTTKVPSIVNKPTVVPTSVTQPPTVVPTSATVQPGTGSNYSAIQPGPGCDTNGGTWTPQGISKISCGTSVSTSANDSRGYLDLQLPNNKAFAPNNTIGIIGNVGGSGYSGQCVGLDELDANRGFLVEYCTDGSWDIYSISSDGTIVKTLDKGITSTRQTEDISLTLKDTTLSFSIDSEVHKINGISPIQPIKVAITYSDPNSTITTDNFSYTVLSS